MESQAGWFLGSYPRLARCRDVLGGQVVDFKGVSRLENWNTLDVEDSLIIGS